MNTEDHHDATRKSVLVYERRHRAAVTYKRKWRTAAVESRRRELERQGQLTMFEEPE